MRRRDGALKRVSGFAGRVALLGLHQVAKRVPLPVLYSMGERLGRVAYRLSRRYRTVAERNLQMAYGHSLSEEERRQLVQQVFIHFAKSLMEFLVGDGLSTEDLRRMVTLVGEEHLQWCLQQGKGTLVITAHYGNWEIAARYLTQCKGYVLNVVARDADDSATAVLVNRIREQGGYRVIPRGQAARRVLQALKRNELVALLPDQNAGDVFVPFFGRLAGTVAGPALLALRSGAPLLPVFCTRQPDNTYLFEMLPPFFVQSSGDKEHDVLEAMTRINTLIEQQVRKHPSQWLWLHNRWKTRPPEEAHATGAAR
ncbi:MAG: lysophospholipid acyltransferase family protein [Armatimonadota bacterium]|nr:lysophospholipid acyltransferase family protein [Armatimonadota bacterium]